MNPEKHPIGRTHNPLVPSSTLGGPTNQIKGLARCRADPLVFPGDRPVEVRSWPASGHRGTASSGRSDDPDRGGSVKPPWSSAPAIRSHASDGRHVLPVAMILWRDTSRHGRSVRLLPAAPERDGPGCRAAAGSAEERKGRRTGRPGYQLASFAFRVGTMLTVLIGGPPRSTTPIHPGSPHFSPTGGHDGAGLPTSRPC